MNQSEVTIPKSTWPASADPPIEEVFVKEATLAEEAPMKEVASIGRHQEGPSTSQTQSEGPTRREPLPNRFSG